MAKLLNWAMLFLLVGGLFLFRPSVFGGQFSPVIVHGLSMEPTMFTGDLAIAHKQVNYEVGDVVAFDTGEGLVIHRIIGGTTKDGFMMQGDNNSWIDPWEPTPSEIVGKALVFVPRLGSIVSFLQDPLRLSIAVGVTFFYMSVAGFVLSYRGRGSRERRRKRRGALQNRRAGLTSWLST